MENYPNINSLSNNPDMTNFEKWGHFSQIVWAASTSVGCATFDCNAQGLANVASDTPKYFTVCNYYPEGNMGGQYHNVGAPKGQPYLKVYDPFTKTTF